MKKTDITMLGIKKISKMIKNREISPVEIVEECVKRTKKRQPELNAYITFLEREAKEKAKIIEKEIMAGNYKGFLHGVPIALKDLFFTKGILTTAASKFLSDFKPEFDSTITDRLNRAGTILMGKTNLHEWAFGPTNEDSHYGATRNPWDSTRITGGSSGGSAVVVATGMAYLAMGTDTGGSIRIPAAMCGIVGFKPTYGLASCYGVIPLSFTFDHTGPMARSVYDISIAMDAISGNDSKDPCPGRYKGKKIIFSNGLDEIEDLKGIRLGIPMNFYFDKVDYEIEELVKNAILNFEKIGATIESIEIPYLDRASEVSNIIMYSEVASLHKERLERCPNGYKKPVKERLEEGIKYRATEYILALQEREKLISAWNKVISKVDAVVVPTVPMAAYKIGTKIITSRGKEEPAREMCVRHTRFGNVTGCPALSIPCGLTMQGLPAGIMIMGANYNDNTILKIGYTYEKHYPILLGNPNII